MSEEQVETQPTQSEETQPQEQSIDPAYVEQLRREAAERRAKLKTYEDVFGLYDDEDRQVWFELAKTVAQDPKEGGKMMYELGRRLLGEEPEPETPQTETSPDPVQIVDKIVSERLSAWEEEQQIREIQQEARALGYDPDSREYLNLLWVAYKETNGDLKAAHQKIEADKERLVQEFLEAQKAQNEQFPPQPASGTVAGSEREIKTLEDAKASMKERLRALFSQA
jgi:hypothetical protein